jgi:hypothetical protein
LATGTPCETIAAPAAAAGAPIVLGVATSASSSKNSGCSTLLLLLLLLLLSCKSVLPGVSRNAPTLPVDGAAGVACTKTEIELARKARTDHFFNGTRPTIRTGERE